MTRAASFQKYEKTPFYASKRGKNRVFLQNCHMLEIRSGERIALEKYAANQD
jgi:hypothetical protein